MLVPDPTAPGGERAKLLDFGIAKFAPGAEEAEGKSGTQSLHGTPAYMSPEQCKGTAPVDSKSDVYSLGVMLFVMLSGKRPFTGVGAADVMAKHIHDSPPPLQRLCKTLPPGLPALVHRLLAKDKRDRPELPQVLSELAALSRQLGLPVLRGLALHPSAKALPADVDDEALDRQSTLGRSVGQGAAPPGGSSGLATVGARKLGAAVALAAVVLICVFGVQRWRIKSGPAAPKPPARPLAPPVVPVAVAQVPAVVAPAAANPVASIDRPPDEKPESDADAEAIETTASVGRAKHTHTRHKASKSAKAKRRRAARRHQAET